MIILELSIAGALTLIAGWATFFAFYQLVLGCLYFLVPDKAPVSSEPRKRFSVVIPAHNEEIIIGTALESWKQVQYPHDHFRIYVVADNCTDRTAEIARAHGAVCLERNDSENRGKGQALAWALKELPLDTCDAVVFVDADCMVSPEFLTAMNRRLLVGAKVIQGFDGVLNPDDSMLTRLMHITNVMKNLLFAHAKSKLGLSVQLMGTGMCFDRLIIQEMAWKAFSIGEDIEQSAYLAQAGIRVEFEPKAVAYAQEASSLGQAYSQRVRWASSRMQLFGLGARMLMGGLQKHNFPLIDAALSLLAPNYAMLANMTLAGLLASLATQPPMRSLLVLWFTILLAAQVMYFGMGMIVSKLSIRALSSLTLAPIFLLWKLGIDIVAIFNLKRSLWTRTGRAPHASKQ